MDYHDFRDFSSASIEFIINYLQTIRDRDVMSSAKPHDIVAALPKEIPQKPDHWKDILKDLDEIILPGLTHWQSPHFHAFYPSASSFGSIVGELLISGLGVLGFNWICSPACTELEVVVMDWLAKFLRLPEQFLHSSKGPGGGIIQGSASESVLVAVIAAREQAVRRIQAAHPEMSESDIRGKLVAYSSDQSNSCIEKAGVLGALPIRLLATEDDGLVLKGDTLRKAVEEDVAKGFIPVICIATLGTTGTCAYDDIVTLGEVCQQHDIWLHVDAAYAGAAFALEEHDHLRAGLERVDSLNFNLHKFLMVNFDCGAMWLRDANKVVDSFNVDRIYLKHNYEGQSQIPDFRHWQIPLGRRFRALKVWITCRTIGAEGFRAYIRKHMALAERFEQHVLKDDRFEIVTKRTLGLVCFRAKGDNSRTTGLLERLTARKKIYMVQAIQKGQHFLRFVVCGMEPKEEDIDFAWNEIQTQMGELLLEEEAKSSDVAPEELTGPLTNGEQQNDSSYEQSAKSDANLLAQNLSSSLHLTADNSKNI